MTNKVWYYQSGPKSVSINTYGILEPPKPIRNCQSLDWVQKTKKFESLGGQGEFLMTGGGCMPTEYPTHLCFSRSHSNMRAIHAVEAAAPFIYIIMTQAKDPK